MSQSTEELLNEIEDAENIGFICANERGFRKELGLFTRGYAAKIREHLVERLALEKEWEVSK
jgi:hypothetical protein